MKGRIVFQTTSTIPQLRMIMDTCCSTPKLWRAGIVVRRMFSTLSSKASICYCTIPECLMLRLRPQRLRLQQVLADR